MAENIVGSLKGHLSENVLGSRLANLSDKPDRQGS